MVSRATTTPVWQSLTVVLFVLSGVVGCKSPKLCCDPGLPTRELACRTGVTMQKTPPCQQLIPPGVMLEDGLSEDEAVLIALSNNSAFQATLAQLGMAHGDAVQANLLMNPQYLIYFPTGAKEGQYTLFAPIESYLLRPTRVKVANREYRRIGETLVQNGLDLARNVRVAYADLAVATQQAQLAQEALQIRGEVFDVTEKRLEDGDISELETITAKVDRLNAKAAAGVQDQTVAITEARLATLIGLTRLPTPLVPLPLPSPTLPTLDEQRLIDQAFACRPDYNAAKWAVAAGHRRPQRDHVDQPLPPPRRRRTRHHRSRADPPRSRRTFGPDSDDSPDHRLGPRALDLHRRTSRPRNRIPHGPRHPHRPSRSHDGESASAAGAVFMVGTEAGSLGCREIGQSTLAAMQIAASLSRHHRRLAAKPRRQRRVVFNNS